MKYIVSGYKGDAEKLILKTWGDIHLGSPHFRMEAFKRELDFVDRHREHCRIIYMGDGIELATRYSVGAGVYEQNIPPQEQTKELAKLLRDFVDLIEIGVPGNHELRAYKELGFDLTEDLFDRLGIPERYAGYQGMLKISWNNRCYQIAVWHGAGGGGTPGSSLNKVVKQRDYILADIYLMGHVHHRLGTQLPFFISDPYSNSIRQIQQTFAVTGSMLGYEGSYAEQAGMSPGMIGFPTLFLSGRTLGKTRKRDKHVELII